MAMRVGHLSTFYHTSMLLMAGRDASGRLGADIEWRLFGTGPAIVEAFEKGELDLAYIGLPPAIIGIDRGVDIICIAGGHVEGTVISGKKELLGFPDEEDLGLVLKQLRGRKIGVPGKGSIHDVILTESLERFALKGDVEVINFQWADGITEAMAGGGVSAAAGTPALAAAIKRYAGGKMLYPPSKLWPNNPSYGIVAERGFLGRERRLAERFLELHEEAEMFLRDRPREASEIISGHVGFVDAELVMDTLKISPKYCAKLTGAYISCTMEFVKILKRLGYIKHDVPRDDIFDTSLIEKAHPEKDHYMDGLSE